MHALIALVLAIASIDIQGRVTDEQGMAVAGASVTIEELSLSTTTSSDGRFRFNALPDGRYTISARRAGFSTAATAAASVASSGDVNLVLRRSAAILEPVNVTASRSPVSTLMSPLPTSFLAGEDIHREGSISLAHSLAKLPGVRTVSSGEQIGKPLIRGLVGPRVLVLDDGSRIEDYSWSDEDAPSLDSRLAQRVEVIRGPASVLYGSEALSGVVNVLPVELTWADDGGTRRKTAFELYGASNNKEAGAGAMYAGASSKYAWRALGMGRFAQNYSSPSEEIQNSGMFAGSGDVAFGVRHSTGTSSLRIAGYGGEFHLLEASGPEEGDSTGGPVRQALDIRAQLRDDRALGSIRLETKAQFQRHGLAEVSDDCVPAPGETTCQKVKDQKAFGLTLNTGTLDLLAHHSLTSAMRGTIGVSGLLQSSSTEGPIFLVPEATSKSIGAFAVEEFTSGPITLTAGGRGDYRSLSSDASVPLSLAADNRNWSNVSGDVGLVVRPASTFSFVANAGTGWRAPTLFDLYTNGPNLAEARYEIGDPALKSERAVNIDGGVRYFSEIVRAELTGFRNTIDNFIFVTPTSQRINNLQVFRHLQSDARLTGMEAALEVRPTNMISLRASHDFVHGDDLENDQPLPLMPPARTLLGAEINPETSGWLSGARAGAEVQIVEEQKRLNPEDYATDGYALLNLDFGIERALGGIPLRIDLNVRNATNKEYKDFLSRYKTFAFAQGRTLILRVSTANW
jgi:outer membrane receptor protein involved in Fe transport